MDISENPFFVLGATPRDRKSRLIELSENLTLSRDQELIAAARNTLLNARQRLAAEVAWFPGVSPQRIALNLKLSQEKPVVAALSGLPILCCANLLAASLGRVARRGAKPIQEAIASLAKLVDAFDAAIVMRDINEDRQASGFPAVSDRALVEAELTNRKNYYKRAITHLLASTLSAEQRVSVYERLVAEGTSDGEDEAPQLISDLVNIYEIETKAELDERAEEIAALIEKTRAIASVHGSDSHGIHGATQQIISLLRVWDMIAQPVQLSKKSKGLDHAESSALAFKVRSLAIDLFNEHDYLNEATSLSKELEKLFAEVPAVLDKVSADIQALDDIHLTRNRLADEAREKKAEFAAAVTYETTFGLIFKDRFRISADGIEWKNSVTSLESITGVSWGAIRHSTNGVNTGTTHHIRYLGNSAMAIEFRDSAKHSAITKCLWRGICVRLLLTMIETWKKGGSVHFGGVEVRDDGIMLKRPRLFKADEQEFHTWFELAKGVHDGALFFVGHKDKRFKANLSFISTYNVHVLDFVLDRVWEGKARRLSETLD
ncbi:hypothetical protein ELE36_09275 [Pseudolysobacter antarcticus]|uniref:Uncharacterized protein n=1 Tax=Pseudolysobacter antarcticus TaxID=2511995 RepID=A0A411HJ71_9GAMM|nr:hypothetical protein [Pseudolysobacter antarcticus]QBB70538.1 hypothetical protein ELE36_09275 [Pseudolysobacter antarcticus]